jgi:hypothetical protein
MFSTVVFIIVLRRFMYSSFIIVTGVFLITLVLLWVVLIVVIVIVNVINVSALLIGVLMSIGVAVVIPPV